MARLALTVRGVVQGVGFRPFVYRIARERGLSGFVQNQRGVVAIEVEGARALIEAFLEELRAAALPARVDAIEQSELPERRDGEFVIRESNASAEVLPTLPADLATCAECLAEVASPEERRHRYPFTNCTRCGPRYSIVESLPYDRARTSMKDFVLCADCAREYADVADRRFHAQPIACPACGPQLALLDPTGRELARGDDALRRAAEAIRRGEVLALRGLGGFQLLCDAESETAVTRLRRRKRREEKPFAVMFPDRAALGECAELSPEEERALTGAEAPIVLLRLEASTKLAAAVAPQSPLVGAMLPYTPLHALLLREIARAVVCTSGNLSEEPMAVDVPEALGRLAGIADAFLVHDRPIVRPVDDSVVRVGPAGMEVLRRARGFAPRPVAALTSSKSVLALGAHMKSSIALCQRGQIVASQHLGDLENVESVELLERTVDDFVRFFDAKPDVIACDLHPDYASTHLAEALGKKLDVPLVRVQHHHAHIAAVLAEHGISEPVLGLSWDGTGFGSDGTIWGGEVLRVDGAEFERVAALRSFRLPGGDRAAREPRRGALGLLHALDPALAAKHAERWFGERDGEVLLRMLASGVQAPETSSMGRLFDAVAALAGLHGSCSFEGQTAMRFEYLAERGHGAPWPIPITDGEPARLDWEPMVRALLEARERGAELAELAARFHASLGALIVTLARHFPAPRVVVGGGCFQNRLLLAAARRELDVVVPAMVPVNDGGIAVGQAFVATLRPMSASPRPG
jgi:hydrogenase maturation protein HypF